VNKYIGFYELKSINLPTIRWNLFCPDTVLDSGLLWTVRVAVEAGQDLNLPRIVGATAEEAEKGGKELLARYGSYGMVIYYPYCIAEKSGVMEVSSSRLVIEAVEKDLWNFVTYENKNVTVIRTGEGYSFEGDNTFLAQNELLELERHAAVIRGRFRDELAEGCSILAEWSYAYNTDIRRQTIGNRYLVFFELRAL
jgi:hypothetical protein